MLCGNSTHYKRLRPERASAVEALFSIRKAGLKPDRPLSSAQRTLCMGKMSNAGWGSIGQHMLQFYQRITLQRL